MPVGIIGAMGVEVELLKAEMTDVEVKKISSRDFYKGKLHGRDVVVVTCGVGKVNAALVTEAMILEFKPDYIINTGVAGGISGKTDIGSIALSDFAVQHDIDTTIFGDPLGFISSVGIVKVPASQKLLSEFKSALAEFPEIKYTVGTVATGDQFISDSKKKLEIVKEFDAVCFEMEGGSIAQVAYLNGVDFLILRAISDTADGDAVDDYPEFLKLAAERAAKLIKLLLSGHGRE